MRTDERITKMGERQHDLTRVVLAVLFIVTLIGSSLWILRPFLAAIVWAATIVIATWPLMISLQKWLWGKRGLAVAVMTVLLLCLLVMPLTFAIGTIVANVDEVACVGKVTRHLQGARTTRMVSESAARRRKSDGVVESCGRSREYRNSP